jgi:hypothetical protein
MNSADIAARDCDFAAVTANASPLLLLLLPLPKTDVNKGKRLKKAAIVGLIALFMLAVGIIAGFFISKAIGFNLVLQQQAAEGKKLQPDGSYSDGSGVSSVAGFRRGVIGDIAARYQQWPDPSSPEAQQLAQDPNADGERHSTLVC